jgi:hypothetical protein
MPATAETAADSSPTPAADEAAAAPAEPAHTVRSRPTSSCRATNSTASSGRAGSGGCRPRRAGPGDARLRHRVPGRRRCRARQDARAARPVLAGAEGSRSSVAVSDCAGRRPLTPSRGCSCPERPAPAGTFRGAEWTRAALAPCSLHLKIRPCRAWLTEHTNPSDTILYIGLDASEPHRAPAITRGWGPWPVQYPLREPPLLSKQDMLDWCTRLGIRPPRLYQMGFPHNFSPRFGTVPSQPVRAMSWLSVRPRPATAADEARHAGEPDQLDRRKEHVKIGLPAVKTASRSANRCRACRSLSGC